MVSTGVASLDKLLSDGYPDRSSVLVVGPPGIGKEGLGHRFTQTGLVQGDFCLYVTRLSVREIPQDTKGLGIDVPVTVVSLLSVSTSSHSGRGLCETVRDRMTSAVLPAPRNPNQERVPVMAVISSFDWEG